jgi:hypothetical protein
VLRLAELGAFWHASCWAKRCPGSLNAGPRFVPDRATDSAGGAAAEAEVAARLAAAGGVCTCAGACAQAPYLLANVRTTARRRARCA